MNFCLSFLGTKIYCDKPSNDNFELTNLINNNEGFVCESFIRPPIDIRIDFPVPIDISWIKLHTKVGNKISTSFKIYSEVTRGERGTKRKYEEDGDNKQQPFCLGNWYALSEPIILLKNYNYKPSPAFPLPNSTQVENQYTGALKNSNKLSLSCAISIIISITKVSPFGPPVLKSLQIWGQPSALLSLSQREKIYNLWINHSRIKENSEHSSSPLNAFRTEESSSENNLLTNTELIPEGHLESSGNVPEEFLDPFTCEIMTLPVLLPSGNSIDSSSLEKFLSTEAAWGRTPCDPFTGVAFKKNYKPEPNIHLKERIDRFFLIEKNLPSCSNSRGRTLGGSKDSSSSEREESTQNSKFVEFRKAGLNFASGKPEIKLKNTKIPERTVKDERKYTAISKKPCGKFSEKQNSVERRGGHSLVKLIGAAISSSSKTSSQNCARNISFNADGCSTSKSPEFTDSSEEYSLNHISKNKLQCFCGSNSGPFYSLKCSHHICNVCLRSKLQKRNDTSFVVCEICHSETKRDQIFRTHPKSAFS